MKHKCQEGRSCCCSITALEPDDDCPLHGYPFPPRCEICGRYMKWPKTNFSATSIAMATVGMVDELTGLPVPLFPEPPQVRANEIWPDYMIDWLPK
jgi:hypothetical protein